MRFLYNVLRRIYDLGFILMLPLVVVYLLLRARKLPAYRQRVLERFGFWKENFATGGIWLHAVSVGEVTAALPLLRLLLDQHPNLPITVTTTTPTGSMRLRQLLGNRVQHVYIPYDVSFLIDRFLRRIQPCLVCVMETELWPNLLNVCEQRAIPIMLLNARISDNSFRGYQRLGFITRRMLQQFSFIATQSALDMQRLLALGANPATTQNLGNLKYDVGVNIEQINAGQELRQALSERTVIVAASTHADEEQQILDAFMHIKENIKNALLVLIPRHPNRFTEVAELIAQHNFCFVRRSTKEPCTEQTVVWLGDTMGELTIFYALADIVFVGGSLVPIGGHNLLEPAAVGCAIITGKHIENFRAIADELQQNSALIMVQDAEQLSQQIQLLCANFSNIDQLRQNALSVVAKHTGVSERVLAVISVRLQNLNFPVQEPVASY